MCRACVSEILTSRTRRKQRLPHTETMGVAVVRPEIVERVMAEMAGLPIQVVHGGLAGLTESRVRGLEGWASCSF